ncbi:MAG: 2-C-methyl-D-erythritol 2,4-cyclodiphosphate synthase [Firmicutes bacterium]|nr:2-C-methyl-D-erythritol 2,4-cyclodiphosphate synthase [Bacillota bacterium]
MFTGIGYDVHRFTEGRKLILGGVEIPYEKGLEAHSDGDVLLHAVMDALLGACGLGDIGMHFPDTDDRYKGASSMDLLKTVRQRMRDEGYEPVNVDAVIVAQAPKMAPYAEFMKAGIAEALALSPARVNVKATTTEGLGFEGRGEGISAQAVACVSETGYRPPPAGPDRT